ncbi:MAG: MBL fold metallo-hydrolase [Verrucomicrobia bacterium]|nr:MBL fold metallo-hydrolase [Verrucomicrobiota bacterium]
MSNHLTITGYSTALFSTWYFVNEFGVLFDCGDGVSAGLLQKARKVKHVFISHADRDHVAGLLQFNQLNARAGLNFYYPKDCGSFPAMAEFSSRFDPHVSGTQWIPLEAGQEVRLRHDLLVRTIENRHVPAEPGQFKSLSYAVDRISRRLKPEFSGRSGEEIAAVRQKLGDAAITDEARSPSLIYSGDTPPEWDGRYHGAEVLIHEATFLTAAEIDPDDPKRNKHSSLDQVMKMVAGSKIKKLILGHFSSRYSNEQIDEANRPRDESPRDFHRGAQGSAGPNCQRSAGRMCDEPPQLTPLRQGMAVERGCRAWLPQMLACLGSQKKCCWDISGKSVSPRVAPTISAGRRPPLPQRRAALR